MKYFIPFFLIALVGCKSPISPSSYWDQQKGNFRYLNKTEFVCDSVLRADLHNLKMSSHPIFKKITPLPVYLYSWQDRESETNEFTVIEDRGAYGLKIYYLTLDKKDSLISYEWIAGQDDEMDRNYMKRSKLSGMDTILSLYYPISGNDPVTKKKFVPDWNEAARLIIEKDGVFTVYLIEIELPERRAFINFWKNFSLKFKLLDTTFIKKHSLKKIWFWGKGVPTSAFFKDYYNHNKYFNLLNDELFKIILDTNKTDYGTIGCSPSIPVKNAVRRQEDNEFYNCWQVIIRDTLGPLVTAYQLSFLETKADYKFLDVYSYTYKWSETTQTNKMVDTTGPER